MGKYYITYPIIERSVKNYYFYSAYISFGQDDKKFSPERYMRTGGTSGEYPNKYSLDLNPLDYPPTGVFYNGGIKDPRQPQFILVPGGDGIPYAVRPYTATPGGQGNFNFMTRVNVTSPSSAVVPFRQDNEKGKTLTYHWFYKTQDGALWWRKGNNDVKITSVQTRSYPSIVQRVIGDDCGWIITCDDSGRIICSLITSFQNQTLGDLKTFDKVIVGRPSAIMGEFAVNGVTDNYIFLFSKSANDTLRCHVFDLVGLELLEPVDIAVFSEGNREFGVTSPPSVAPYYFNGRYNTSRACASAFGPDPDDDNKTKLIIFEVDLALLDLKNKRMPATKVNQISTSYNTNDGPFIFYGD
ncbi:hypothetical protein [Burkholderia sp. TSV86]|uniref:hypothetical protein n=1 Tax=Burkholderia sp. TSV86 TaxID=1385594 RepID=UPI000AFEAB90|nr:hypothetical protein [Burkholderia sp. TSV86]